MKKILKEIGFREPSISSVLKAREDYCECNLKPGVFRKILDALLKKKLPKGVREPVKPQKVAGEGGTFGVREPAKPQKVAIGTTKKKRY